MGREVFKRPVTARGLRIFSTKDGLFQVPTEAITSSTAAQTLSDVGASFITYASSGKPNDIIIPNPPRAGTVKYIFAVNNTTSVELNLNTAATANTFWGTTYNTCTIAAAATGSPGGTPGGTPALVLVAQSTTQWAIVPGTTHSWDLSATTGSTATA